MSSSRLAEPTHPRERPKEAEEAGPLEEALCTQARAQARVRAE